MSTITPMRISPCMILTVSGVAAPVIIGPGDRFVIGSGWLGVDVRVRVPGILRRHACFGMAENGVPFVRRMQQRVELGMVTGSVESLYSAAEGLGCIPLMDGAVVFLSDHVHIAIALPQERDRTALREMAELMSQLATRVEQVSALMSSTQSPIHHAIALCLMGQLTEGAASCLTTVSWAVFQSPWPPGCDAPWLPQGFAEFLGEGVAPLADIAAAPPRDQRQRLRVASAFLEGIFDNLQAGLIALQAEMQRRGAAKGTAPCL